MHVVQFNFMNEIGGAAVLMLKNVVYDGAKQKVRVHNVEQARTTCVYLSASIGQTPKPWYRGWQAANIPIFSGTSEV